MQRIAIGVTALLFSSVAVAGLARFEIEAEVIWGGLASGDPVLIQIEVDDSDFYRTAKYNVFHNGELVYVDPLPNWSGSTAGQSINPLRLEDGGTIAEPYYVHFAAHHYAWGHQYGDTRSSCCAGYWESAEFWYESHISIEAWSLSGDPLLSGWSLDGIIDVSGIDDVEVVGDLFIQRRSNGCGIYVAFGCAVQPSTSPTIVGLSWRGHTIRTGWTDMTATVSEGALAPLLGLLLWAGIRRRR